jgi:hypothetical protein
VTTSLNTACAKSFEASAKIFRGPACSVSRKGEKCVDNEGDFVGK